MEETIMAKDRELQKYQWVKSERTTEVVQVAEEQPDANWLYFTDGTRINPSLISEFLMEVPASTKIGGFIDVETKPLQTGPIQNEGNVVATNSSDTIVTQQEPVKEPTVMGKMIMKMSKKNVVNVPVQININIPTPQLHAMLSEGMEDADLNEEIIEVALQQIEINKLKEYITANVSEFLSEYYS
jgi:hypothetical protein